MSGVAQGPHFTLSLFVAARVGPVFRSSHKRPPSLRPSSRSPPACLSSTGRKTRSKQMSACAPPPLPVVKETPSPPKTGKDERVRGPRSSGSKTGCFVSAVRGDAFATTNKNEQKRQSRIKRPGGRATRCLERSRSGVGPLPPPPPFFGVGTATLGTQPNFVGTAGSDDSSEIQ